MGGEQAGVPTDGTGVTVRYWAAARAAAATETDLVRTAGAVTLADVLAEVLRRHPQPRFAAVLDVCALMVGDRPVGTRDPARVQVAVGETVEVLPPFAGG